MNWDYLVSLFYRPPPFPDVAGGLLVRWTGREAYVKECLLAFYASGYKDGFISCAAVVALSVLAYQLIKGLNK